MDTFLNPFWALTLSIFGFLFSATSTLHCVLNKRDSRSVIGWVGLVWLAPFIGPLVYVCLGINRIKRKAESLNLKRHEPQPILIEAGDENRRVKFIEEFPALTGQINLEKKLSGNELLPGNQVHPLINGDETYPAMIEAIDHAEHSIALLSYIFDHDRAGLLFRESLIKAKNRGVEIRVLIDGVGANYSKPSMIRKLRKDGIEAVAFLPVFSKGIGGFHYFNLRNHRKILVVDGKVGFTGGTNIREGHCMNLKTKSPVQCLHFKLTGPVVRQLQNAFAADWAFVTGELLDGETWYPELDFQGPVWARGIADGPDENFEVLEDTLLGALASAQKSAFIITPYFLPEAPLIHALNVAALRGVDLKIIIPSKPNIKMVEWASQANFKQLLDKGCKIYLTPEPFDHTKLIVVDKVYALIGSTNWDPRSLRLNFEYNVSCYDDELANKLHEIIDRKLESSTPIDMEYWNATPLAIKLRSGLARLLTPYL